MKSKGALIACLLSAGYVGLVFAWWVWIGADYTDMSSRDRILSSLIVPLGTGCLFLIAAVSWLGWWGPVLSEKERAGGSWTAVIIGIAMLLFVGVNLLTTDWSKIMPTHLLLLVLAGVLVGFNEEVLFRGINVVGFRRDGHGETMVWLATSLVFALAHVGNGMFGTGLAGGLSQAFMVFFAASSYFLLRIVTGRLLVPIVFHGLWDFSIFAQEASGADRAVLLLVPLDLLISIASMVFVGLVLRHRRDQSSA